MNGGHDRPSHRSRSHCCAEMTGKPSNKKLTRKIQSIAQFVHEAFKARELNTKYEVAGAEAPC